MQTRHNLLDIFSTFLRLEGDTIRGWLGDARLQRSMQACLDQSQQPETSEGFWVLYWHKLWQANKPPVAVGHLSAYLQEPCYWAAQKLTMNLSGGESIVDFFQIAIARVDRVLKGFNPQQGNTLKQYASLSFSNVIKDTLRMRREVEICTDWALLHKVSHRRLTEALQNLGLGQPVLAQYILAWQCFQALYSPQTPQAARKLTKPTADTFAAISTFYNQERLTQLGTATTATTAVQIEEWLLTCGQAIRSYLYPTLLSPDAKINPEGDAFLDNFESTFQASTLSSVIEEEEALSRQDYKSQLNAVLLRALVKLDLAAQRLLQVLWPRSHATRTRKTDGCQTVHHLSSINKPQKQPPTGTCGMEPKYPASNPRLRRIE